MTHDIAIAHQADRPAPQAQPMSDTCQLLELALDDQRYALHLSAVERIVRVVAITPLPQAPSVVLGIINVHGRVVPVIDLRRRLQLPQRPPRLSDQLIIAHSARRPLALVADAVVGVVACPLDAVVPPGAVLPRVGYVAGIVKLPGELVLIHDLDTFLSLDEEQTLARALPQPVEHAA